MSRIVRLVHSKDYLVDIGAHVFPTSKYDRIKEKIIKESPYQDDIKFESPQPASQDDVLLVHTKDYINKLKNGLLSKEEILTLELPYSKELVDASFKCCGGTILASRIAFEGGVGIHIGGGFHHAFPDHGEGFCILNDIAVAIKWIMKERPVKRAMVIDCDLHQGNGTAYIFSKEEDVFTFSIHQEDNYPFFKPRSSLDIGLRDRASDREYLGVLHECIPKAISDFKPDFLVFVAGADPYREDQIGGLALTKDGLKKRDEFIFRQAINYQIPICVVLAGGYAFREEDTVEIHFNTIMTGLALFYPLNRKTLS